MRASAGRTRIDDLRQPAAIFLAISLISVLVALAGGGTTSARSELIGAQAPDFGLLGADGRPTKLSDLRDRPVWLTFFSTWCTRCRAENPDIEAVHREEQKAGRDLFILGVGVAELPLTVREYARNAGLTFPMGADLERVVAPRYGVLTLPTHVFLDRAGVVRQFCVGALRPEKMRQLVDALSAEGSVPTVPDC